MNEDNDKVVFVTIGTTKFDLLIRTITDIDVLQVCKLHWYFYLYNICVTKINKNLLLYVYIISVTEKKRLQNSNHPKGKWC